MSCELTCPLSLVYQFLHVLFTIPVFQLGYNLAVI